ncbi:hypothetical protein QFC20_000934 [Naganishia adeliensis]|uniref:Uncharacterized protein n=1 Tax=Naganishia adeliensis TaxID=92952 RepID=A0ACC2WWS5_9TREE|nr:hypothetical protein QFC20_000934 [Naganishia adeliensis]
MVGTAFADQLALSGDDPERLLGQPGDSRGHDDTALGPAAKQHHPLLRQVATYAGLVPMAFFGVLIRLGFEALGDYDGKVVYPILWAQGVGCAVMGTSLSLKGEISNLYPPLYTALTTG